MPVVLRLRAAPEERLDLSSLAPQRLVGKSAQQISDLEVHTGRRRVTIGDVFTVAWGDTEHVLIEGGCERFDRVGEAMTSGAITVEGDVGNQAGHAMDGGRLTIRGRAGDWAASGMKAGHIEVAGDVGDRLGGPLPGEMQGMSGGMVVVRGRAGERAGDRLRRGIVVIEGGAGADAGSRMLAGSLIVCGRVGPRAGYLMGRGTLALDGTDAPLSPTFIDCGVFTLVASRLMAAFIAAASEKAAALLTRPLRRYAGDMAALGKGELLVGCPAGDDQGA